VKENNRRKANQQRRKSVSGGINGVAGSSMKLGIIENNGGGRRRKIMKRMAALWRNMAKAKIIMKSVGGSGEESVSKAAWRIAWRWRRQRSGSSALYRAAQHENGKMAGISKRIKRRGISGSGMREQNQHAAPRACASKITAAARGRSTASAHGAAAGGSTLIRLVRCARVISVCASAALAARFAARAMCIASRWP
jgi:hypothetical protein